MHESNNDTDITGKAVVIGGKVITSLDLDTAMAFALSIIEILEGKEMKWRKD